MTLPSINSALMPTRAKYMQRARGGSFVRCKVIEGVKIEEYKWGGGLHAFINGHWQDKGYDAIVAAITEGTRTDETHD